METITFQLPNIELERFTKMSKKISKHVACISVEFGKSYKKLYHHTERDIDGNIGRVKMWHEVTDVTVTMDAENDWLLLATYKDGMEFVVNPKKELVVSNPEHGKDYRKCDACGHWCKNSFLLVNIKTGEELQVGKECLKSFGLTGLDYVYEFTKELYRIFDHYGCDALAADEPEWRGGKDTQFAFSSCKTTDLLRAAKSYYNENKVWKKGHYEGRTYCKSKSNEEIQINLENKVFDGDEAYINAVIEYAKRIPAESEFCCDIIEMASNYYTEPCRAAHAYFAIKMYEESRTAKEIGIEKFKVGVQVHVVGNIINTQVLETMFGQTEKTTIECGRILLERIGKVPANGDKVDAYALVKGIKGATIQLDRITKNPKKGIETIEI